MNGTPAKVDKTQLCRQERVDGRISDVEIKHEEELNKDKTIKHGSPTKERSKNGENFIKDRLAVASSKREPMCGHCFEKYSNMSEPRKLPCAHIFCMPCIKLDVQRTHGLRCPTCKEDHSHINIYDLPKIVRLVTPTITHLEKLPETNEEDDEEMPVSQLCDVCTKEAKEAISFCIECSKKMCDKHLEFHDEYQNTFTKKSHNVISVEVYRSFPAKYEIKRCPDHTDRPLKRACESCYRTFCDRCDVKKKCHVLGKAHELTSLDELGRRFKEKMNAMIRSLADKLTDISNIEKKTYGELADLKETVLHMSEEVDRVVNEQISVIRRKAEMLKTEIHMYEVEGITQVEKFITGLYKKKQCIETLHNLTDELLSQSHDADILKEYKQKSDEVETALGIDIGMCQFPFRRMLIRMGDFKDIELQLRDSAPSTMKFRMKEKKSTRVCSTISWTNNKNLLCGRDECLEVRYGASVEIMSSLKTSSVNGVALHKLGLLALYWRDGKNYIILYSPELEFLKLFGEFFRTTDKFSHLACSEKYVAAVDPDNRQLKVFSGDGQHLYDMKLMGTMRPWGVHFLHDGCVLVTDLMAGCLKKYAMRAGSSEPVWVCRDLLSPVGISTNQDGLIFVSSFSAKKIYIISQQGVLLKELTNQKLMNIKEVYDISVVGDQIALACGQDGVVCFQMMFDALVK